jgi:hypothetical protein
MAVAGAASTFNLEATLFMKSLNVLSLIAANRLPRLLALGCAAAYLTLAGCSTFESGTPEAAVNYREPSAATTENHPRSLEQVIQDQRDWYQMND